MPTSLKRTLTETVIENLASAFAAISEIQSVIHKFILTVATERGKQDNKVEQIWIRLFQ